MNKYGTDLGVANASMIAQTMSMSLATQIGAYSVTLFTCLLGVMTGGEL